MFQLPELPYAFDALEPTMSAATLHLHHDKHHAAYVKALNELLGATPEPTDGLEDVIRQSAGGGLGAAKLFHNAAQRDSRTPFRNHLLNQQPVSPGWPAAAT